MVHPIALYSAESWPTLKIVEPPLYAKEIHLLHGSLAGSLLDPVINDIVQLQRGVASVTENMGESPWCLATYCEQNSKLLPAPSTILTPMANAHVENQSRKWQDTMNVDMKIIQLVLVAAFDCVNWYSLI